MKGLIALLMLVALGTTVAHANGVTITFDQSSETGAAGQTLAFFGTITNTTSSTIYLNSDDLNLAGLSTTDQFLNTVPLSLAPYGQAGASSGDIELFDVTLGSPFAGLFAGTYTLFGGSDGGAGTAQDNLGSATFSVSPSAVPEPSTICLLLTGMSAAWVPVSRRLRGRTA